MSQQIEHGARVVAEGLRKTYDGINAVDEIDLTIEPGEFMTLLGPSGSGKSTTLNMISGFTPIDGGSLEIDGQLINDVPARLREIGMVFQNYALFPHMTVTDNIAFPLKQRKMPKKERNETVSRVLDTVRLQGLDHRYPAQLSGGQQQRVALARAIVFKPRVLLMDEPLGALDRTLRDNMQLEIRQIQREVGSTVIFVTHDQEEALAMSTRIAVFNHGHIEQIGTSEQLYDDPTNLFTATFLGESNLFPGVLKNHRNSAAIEYTGSSLGCNKPEGIANGSRVTMMIRPERVRLRDVGDPPGAEHSWVEVQVLDEVYLGTGRRLTISLPDGSTGMARENFDRNSGMHPGDLAILSWSRSDAKVLSS